MANSRSGESVLTRYVRLVESFDGSRQHLPLSALARRAGLPLTTTHRLAAELLELGLLSKDAGGNYGIGLRMWELAHRGSPMLDLRTAALPYMEDLQNATGENVTLGTLERDSVLYLERLAHRGSTVNITTIAGRLPVHASSSGLVLLAFSPAQVQDEFLSRPLERFTDTTITDPAVLRRQLAEIRQRGYASMRGIIVPESSGIAAPVWGLGGRVVAALNLIVPVGQEKLNATVPALLTAARGIARSIGADVPSSSTIRLPQLP